jgi:hypothetical protein
VTAHSNARHWWTLPPKRQSNRLSEFEDCESPLDGISGVFGVQPEQQSGEKQ